MNSNRNQFNSQSNTLFNKLLLCGFIFGLFNVAYAQDNWIQHTFVSNHFNLYSITSSLNPSGAVSSFVVVGDSGTILTSTERPDTTTNSWSNQTTGIKSSFLGVTNEGIICVGENGIIISNNKIQESGTKRTLRAIARGTLSVIVGDSGTILTSPNDSIWTSQISGTIRNLNSVCYFSKSPGLFIVVGDSGIILTSSDGIIWAKQYSGTVRNINAISGNGIPVAVGDSGTIISSKNSTTWTFQNSGTLNNLLGIYCINPPVMAKQLANKLTNDSFRHFCFLIVGSKGTILSALDSVTIWKSHNSGTNKNLHSVSSASVLYAIVVGDSGTILTSNLPTYTGGTKIISTEQNGDLHSVIPNEYLLSNKALVSITVFDLKGRVVKIIANQMQQPGLHKIDVPKNLSSGAYILSLNAEGQKIDRLIMVGK